MPQASEDPVVGVFVAGREILRVFREVREFLEFKGDAAGGPEIGKDALAMVAHDLHDVVVREPVAHREEQEDGAAGRGLRDLALDDEAEIRGRKDDGRFAAVHGKVPRGGKEETAFADEELDGVAIDEEAQRAGEAITLYPQQNV